METARSLMSTMRDRNKNQFQNKGKDWGGILGNKANEVADEGYWWLYSCCCAFIQAGTATSDSCTKRLPGRVEDVHYWLVSRGEERGVWSYELTGGSREGMIDLSRWQHQTNCFKSLTHDATYYYHKMHGLCILFKYRYHIRTIIIINWRFHARLALGSCGSQDLWGLSEWPASINEHGAIKSSSKSRGWTSWVRVNQTNPGTAIIIDHFLKSVTCLIIDNNYRYHIPRQRHISNYRFLSLSYKR